MKIVKEISSKGIPMHVWEREFTLDEMNAIAELNKIPQSEDPSKVSWNIISGKPFKITIIVEAI